MVYMERVNRVQGKRAKWQDGKAKEEEAERWETTSVFLPRKEQRASEIAQRLAFGAKHAT